MATKVGLKVGEKEREKACEIKTDLIYGGGRDSRGWSDI